MESAYAFGQLGELFSREAYATVAELDAQELEGFAFGVHLWLVEFQFEPGVEERDDLLQQLYGLFFGGEKDHKVVGIADIVRGAREDELVEGVQVEVGEQRGEDGALRHTHGVLDPMAFVGDVAHGDA